MKEVQARTIEVLNHLFKLDPAAMSLLMEIRVMANEALTADKDAVLMVLDNRSEPGVRPGDNLVRNADLGLGLLGIINQILGPQHRVAMNMADDGKVLLGFVPYTG